MKTNTAYKLLTLVLSILMVVIQVPFTALAQTEDAKLAAEETIATVTFSDNYVYNYGGEVWVDITVDSASAYNSISIAQIKYDSENLTFLGFEKDDDLESKSLIYKFDEANMSLLVGFSKPVTYSGSVGKLKFQTYYDVGAYEISSDSVLVKNSSVSFPVTVNPGTVFVDEEQPPVPFEYYDVYFYVDGEEYFYTSTNDLDPTIYDIPADPTKDGYTFVGWALEEGGEVVRPSDAMGTTYFYAVFKEIHVGSATVVFSDETGCRGEYVYVDIAIDSEDAYNSIAVADIKLDDNLEFVEFVKNETVDSTCMIYEFDESNMSLVVGFSKSAVYSGSLGKIKVKISDDAKLDVAEAVGSDRIIVKDSSDIFSVTVYAGSVTPIPKPYSVTFYVNNKEYSSQTVSEGSCAALPCAPSVSGYTFCGWSLVRGGALVNVEEYVITDDTDFYGVFSVVQHSVTFYVNGEAYDVQSVMENGYPTDPASPSLEGYTFKGWAETEGGTVVNPLEIAVKSDVSYYAVFEAKEPDSTYYTVVFQVDDVVYKEVEVPEYSFTFAPADPKKDGFIFKGWSTTGDEVVDVESVCIKGNTTFYAVFAAIPKASVSISSISGEVGEYVDIAVSIDSEFEYDHISLLNFAYDADVLEFVEFVDVEAFKNIANPVYSSAGGKLVVSATLNDAKVYEGNVVVLKFKLLSAGAASVSCSASVKNGSELFETTVAKGTVTATAPVVPTPPVPSTVNVVSISTASANKGEYVDVAFSIESVEKWNSFAVSDFTYNTSKLEFVDFIADEELQDTAFMYTLDKNKMAVTVGFIKAAKYNGTLFSMRFKLLDGPYSDVSSDRVILKNGSKDLDVVLDDGRVYVIVPATGVSLNKHTLDIKTGKTLALIASVNPINAKQDVIWSSSDSSVATVNNGIVKGVGNGTATITVKTVDGGFTDTCTVNVTTDVTGVNLNADTLRLKLGTKYSLVATVAPENASNKNVKWFTSDSSVVEVDNTGNIYGAKIGTATVTVKTRDGDFSDSVVVTVDIPVTDVKLNKNSMILDVGKTDVLVADVAPANATNKTVVWTSSDSNVASVKDGVVTAVANGSATITVTTADGKFTDTCSVYVGTPVVSVTLDKSTLALVKNETYTLTATIKPDTATNKNVTWTSSDESVAVVENGKVTALKAGTATITVETEDGKFTASCVVSVTVPVSGVELDKERIELAAGSSETLVATVLPEDATNKKLVWSTSNAGVATVKDGVVTAVAAGGAVITVKTEDGSFRDTCTVVVTNPVTGVALNIHDLSMKIGAYKTLTATVSPSNATNKNVTWSSSDESVATVAANGRVKAVGSGYAEITVTTVDGGFTDTCKVTIIVSVTGVSLNKENTTVNVGGSETLTASVLPSNATNKNVTWSSSDESVATVKDGVVTGVKAGTATIKVTTVDGGFTDTCKVTVVVPVVGVKLNKDYTEISIGKTETLTASVLPSNATNKNVTWTSSDESVATVKNGVVTAVKAGTATITVKTVDGGFEAECKVTVTVPVTGVKLDKTSATIAVGKTETLTATVLPVDATNKFVTWSSSDESVATVKDGTVKAVKAGTATITVKTVDGGFEAECKVSVVVPVTGVELDKNEVEIAEGKTETLTATVLPFDATNKDVTWTSSDESVATVKDGVVTAVKAGTATITVKTVDGEFTAECNVKVVVPVTGVELDKTTLTLNKKATSQLVATVIPYNATNKGVEWISSNEEVATVENGVVTAVEKGIATITVKTVDGGYEASCEVNVIVKTEGVKLDKENITIKIGETETVTASILPEDASDKSVEWTSDNEEVATVDGGVITAVGAGNAKITVTTNDGGFKASVDVTVIVPVTGVELDKEKLSLKAGETAVITATVSPSNATNKNVTWTSSDESVATVKDGVVTAIDKGVATITATTVDGGFIAECKVAVTTSVPSAKPATFVLSDKTGMLDTEIVIDVTLETEESYNSISLSDFVYNTDVFEFVGFVANEEVESMSLMYTLDEEKQAVTIGFITPKKYSGKLFSIKFKVKKNAPEGMEIISCTEQLKNSSVVIDTKLVPSLVEVRNYLLGDIDMDGDVDIDDAILLFQHSMLPHIYPITYPGSIDFDKDGDEDLDDAILLFQHSMLPGLYPIS